MSCITLVERDNLLGTCWGLARASSEQVVLQNCSNRALFAVQTLYIYVTLQNQSRSYCATPCRAVSMTWLFGVPVESPLVVNIITKDTKL